MWGCGVRVGVRLRVRVGVRVRVRVGVRVRVRVDGRRTGGGTIHAGLQRPHEQSYARPTPPLAHAP